MILNRAWETVIVDEQVHPVRNSVGVVALPLGANIEIAFLVYKSDRL